MQTIERPTFYRDIHKGIRMMLGDLVQRAGTTDFGDPTAVAALRTAVVDGFALLEAHAAHEDSFVEPLLARYAPELAHELAAAHDEQHQRMRSLVALLLDEERGGRAAWTRGQVFGVALSRFVGELQTHMADEEERGMTALWAAMTDEEIEAVHHALVRSVAPPELMATFRWMLPAMRHRDRVAMLAGIQAGAPPEVLAAVLGLCDRVLAAHESAALRQALGAARAA